MIFKMPERSYIYLEIRAESGENRQLGRHLVYVRDPDNKHSAVELGVIVAVRDEGNGFANYVTRASNGDFNRIELLLAQASKEQGFRVKKINLNEIDFGEYDSFDLSFLKGAKINGR